VTDPRPSFFLSRRFLPLFVTQFLGAFNDNLFRQAILILITFGLAESVGSKAAVLNNLAIGLFILPYFLFSALAGQLADKYEKSGQIVWIKLWEIGLMIIGGIGFYYTSLPLLIAVLCGLGLQSTFFGPIKYGILPDLMKQNELLSANAMIEAGTFVAILLGTIIAGLSMASGYGVTGVIAIALGAAVIGTLSGKMVPSTGQADPNLKVTKNIFRSTHQQLSRAWGFDISRQSILGISWIWLYGSLHLSQMPVIAKNHMGGDETVVTLFMAVFSIGIGVGSFLSSKLLKGKISARLTKPALWALILLSVVIYISLPPFKADIELLKVAAFVSSPLNNVIAIMFLLAAIFAGMIIVPMYTILQNCAPRAERSRMIAANNIVNSGFMAGGAITAAIMLAVGFTSRELLLLLGIANFLMFPVALKLHKNIEKNTAI